MEELTIEQKAKAYDEAIKKFDVILNLNTVKERGTIFANDVRKIFPELRESEDEKIKESLMQYIWNIYHREYCPPTPSIETCDKWIAWINEKRYSQKDVDDAYLKGVCDTKQELEKKGNCSAKWKKNSADNKPPLKNSVLIKTTNGFAEGEWDGKYWHQYRWSTHIYDSNVLYWIELHDLDEQGEQKHTEWSDEDEEKLQDCIGAIWDANYYLHDKQEMEAWLKSLKDRIGG